MCCSIPSWRPKCLLSGVAEKFIRPLLHAAGALCMLLAASVAAAPAVDMAPRVQACTACHGKQGRATPDGYFPRIAGKPAGYLHNQLLNFRDGRRSYPQMAYLLQHLTDDYLQEMADYFARLDLPYAPPVAAAVSAATLAQGERLVRWGDASRQLPACVQCHGDALAGVAPFIPGLLGLSRDYVSAQLGAWQTGLRRAHAPDCMARIAGKLTADDVSSIAAWLSSRPVPSRFTPAPAFNAPLPIPCGGMGSPALQAGAEQVQ